jgi:predicted TIM-barrel fold metal-dependent hydrolase
LAEPWLEHRHVVKKPSFAVPKGACDCHAHIVGDRTKYPMSDQRRIEPFPASQGQYLTMLATLGVERMVIVQPSFYGFDNSCTLAAIVSFGLGRARGVCVVEPDVSVNRLRELDAAGFRGVRFNVVAPGGNPLEAMTSLAKKIAPLGWHIQILANHDHWAGLEPLIRDLPVPVVMDHMAYIPANMTRNDPALQAVLRLLDTGRAWIKLTGYRSSVAGYPYADVAPLSRLFIKQAPERCVWGTDWPHPRVKDHMPDEGELLDLVRDWAPEEDMQRRILVDNPADLYGF